MGERNNVGESSKPTGTQTQNAQAASHPAHLVHRLHSPLQQPTPDPPIFSWHAQLVQRQQRRRMLHRPLLCREDCLQQALHRVAAACRPHAVCLCCRPAVQLHLDHSCYAATWQLCLAQQQALHKQQVAGSRLAEAAGIWRSGSGAFLAGCRPAAPAGGHSSWRRMLLLLIGSRLVSLHPHKRLDQRLPGGGRRKAQLQQERRAVRKAAERALGVAGTLLGIRQCTDFATKVGQPSGGILQAHAWRFVHRKLARVARGGLVSRLAVVAGATREAAHLICGASC